MERKHLNGIRNRLSFVPEWNGQIERWATFLAHANEWRVLPFMEAADLLQEFYFIFVRVCERYPEAIDGAHFRALFKRSCLNYVTNQAKKRTRRNRVANNFDEANFVPDDMTVRNGMDEVLTKILQEDAPPAVKQILLQLVETELHQRPERRADPLYLGVKPALRLRETTNEFLCRLANLDCRKNDLRQMVLNWIQGEIQPC